MAEAPGNGSCLLGFRSPSSQTPDQEMKEGVGCSQTFLPKPGSLPEPEARAIPPSRDPEELTFSGQME